MNSKPMKLQRVAAVGMAALFAAGANAGQLTVFERAQFQGRSMTTSGSIPDLELSAFDDVAASAVVGEGTWEACTEAYFRGRCAQLLPGKYGVLDSELRGPVASLRQISARPEAPRVVVRTDAASIVVNSDPRPMVVETPVVSAPVVSAPVVSAPVVSTPVVSTPVVTTPVVSTPVVTTPVVSTPVVTTPVTTPVVSVPIVSTPVVGATVVSAPVVTTTPVVVAATPLVNVAPIPAGPRVVLYQRTIAPIRAIELTASVDDLGNRHFNDRADSAFVSGGVWRLCDGKRGGGTCAEFSPGQYISLGALDGRVSSAYLVAPLRESVPATATVAMGRAVFYQFPNFGPPSAVVEYGRAPDMNWANFRGPAASARVESGSWLVCSDMGYQGECRVLDAGEYPELTRVLASGVASARQVWRPEVALATTRTDYGSLDLYRMQ